MDRRADALTRRGAGEGRIYRRKDGRWEAKYRVQVQGRSVRRAIYAKTRDEVARKLRAALANRDRGLVVADPSETVEAFLASWLPGIRSQLRARSWERYEEHVRLYLVPSLGRLKLSQVSGAHIQAMYGRLIDSGLSSNTVRRVHAALHRALEQAVRWGLVARNVASLVEPPRAICRQMNPLSGADARAFVAAVSGHRLEALFVVAVTAGLRQGELLALRWSDVDLEQGWLRIVGSLARQRGAGVSVTDSKSARSRRRVELTATAVDALRRHRQAQAAERLQAGPLWEDHDLVFCNRMGGYLMASHVSAGFRVVLERAGLPRVRFHDLRHTGRDSDAGQGHPPRGGI